MKEEEIPEWFLDIFRRCRSAGITGETRINWKAGRVAHWHTDVLGVPPPESADDWGLRRPAPNLPSRAVTTTPGAGPSVPPRRR